VFDIQKKVETHLEVFKILRGRNTKKRERAGQAEYERDIVFELKSDECKRKEKYGQVM
jgi:hypothetical protein